MSNAVPAHKPSLILVHSLPDGTVDLDSDRGMQVGSGRAKAALHAAQHGLHVGKDGILRWDRRMAGVGRSGDLGRPCLIPEPGAA